MSYYHKMPGKIRTIQKDISETELGWCQCHEHLFIADGPSRKINSALFMGDEQKSLAEVLLYKKAGGCSLIDAQPYGCGRMAENLVSVSQQANIHIIACTGFHKTEYFSDDEWVFKQTDDTLAAIYLHEIIEGMYSSEHIRLTAKAGVVKCAAIKGEYQANKTYETLFHAAAQAARQTGVPLLVHMDKEADALRVIAFFESYGIRPETIMVCHLDRTKYDYRYHEEVASTGAYLEYDTIHRLKYHSDEKELALISHMVGSGYAGRLLFGLDTSNRRLKSYGANMGLDYILTEFKPLLVERLGANTVNRIMIENPAKFLCF
ncbi:MAG: phosphotriesterase [Eubacteriales bacterium]|nr:phosphotriesterase [Eubacteriales bacterium]